MSDLPQDPIARIEAEIQRLKVRSDHLGRELRAAQQELDRLEETLRSKMEEFEAGDDD